MTLGKDMKTINVSSIYPPITSKNICMEVFTANPTSRDCTPAGKKTSAKWQPETNCLENV